ncbi:MAG: hypothetical protein ABI353_04640 [Isosphaeraceae bacterium]
MDRFDWEIEKGRFETIAYQRAMKVAKRAFRRWPERKREDAIAEFVAKVWATWVYNVEKGKDPVALLGPNMHWAILWVRYDRKVSGRARTPDVYDYRAGLRRQQLDGQGHLSPTDQGDPLNSWIDWGVDTGDDPAALAAALEMTGMSLEDWMDN